MNKPAAQRHILGNIGLVLGSLVVGLLLLELGLRIWSGAWLVQWPNFVLYARTVHNEREAQRFIDDSELGYIPRPGYASGSGSGTASFDGEGLRRNGAVPAQLDKVIVATGDSYTYGDEVGDGETWPAHLQALTGARVLNGGVSGYGFDQSVLRAERIARGNHPAAVVVSFIADDLRRTEMKRLWGAEKPYFDLKDGRLVLRNVPVPPRPDPWSTLNFWQRAFGWSYLMQFVVVEHFGFDWFDNRIRVHREGTGERIACLLTGRLAELQRTSGARVLVMAQYDPYVWQDAAFEAKQRRASDGVLACAKQNGLATLDTFEALAGSGNPRGLYGQWHLNDKGNALTAKLVAATLTH
ncbi:MAG: hypothetical protein JOY81_09640 [Alphaproteobacteria bacterium]|nr:hypothetical protein [Alphaproteobacteria bacterium]